MIYDLYRMARRYLAGALALLFLALPAFHSVHAEGAIRGYTREGGYVTLEFGTFPYEADGTREPICWRVLQADGAQALLMSEEVLDTRPAHEGDDYDGFEGSTLSAWLKEGFPKEAFNADELAALARVEGQPDISLPTAALLRDETLGFPQAGLRAAPPTPYALSRGLQDYNVGREAAYWIADRAETMKDAQRRVMEEGQLGYSPADTKNIGVRPILRLDLSRVNGMEGSGTADDPFILLLDITPLPSPSPSPVPTVAPAMVPAGSLLTEGFPALTEAGFLPEGLEPFVFRDEENGVWRYASQTLRLIITRHEDKEAKLRWFETQILFAEGESLRMYPNDPVNTGKMARMNDIAKQNNLVYAMNGDYYIYRANRYRNTKGKVAIGRVARGGKLLFDTAVSENRRTHPNLDLMALYPDGTMSVHGANGATAQALLDAGARDVLSFGPYLIRDGVINKQGVINFGVTQQPRAGIGMVRRGHFVHVIVESRTSKSRGVNTAWLADRFELLGCDTAFNLDGGQTAVLIFMGEQLNEIGKYDDKTNSRLQNEIMGIGTMNAP
jgi:hypothetical protein